MTLFSEIYGAYFRIASAVLERETVTASDLERIVAGEGFRDSVLFIPDKLRPGEGSWGLLEDRGNGEWGRVTSNPPVTIVTELQKRWLKAKLSDPKMWLFLTDEELAELSGRLSDIVPLYSREQIRQVDTYSDGDDFTSPDYRRHFRDILTATKEKRIIYILFRTGSGKIQGRLFVPLKIEYSPKNDKFRVYCRNARRCGNSGNTVINIGRVIRTDLTDTEYPSDLRQDEYFSRIRCQEPAVIKVSQERSGVERFLMEFSSYEKRTGLDTETGDCTVTLWYDRTDETELLIRLLSFGPVVEILSPPGLRAQAAERVRKQYRLIYGGSD